MIIEIATATSRNSTNWRNEELDWASFLEKLRAPIRTRETAVQYHTGSKESRDKAKDVGGFVGGNVQGGRRTSRSILYRTLITLDLDNATADTLETIRIEASGWTWALYSTHSHTADKPRLRLILPLDREVTTDEYQAIARRIAGDLTLIEECDDSTYQPERLMYWPSTSSDGPYLFESSDGDPVCADEILDRYDNWQDYTEWPHSSRATVKVHKSVQALPDPRTKTGVVGAFCRAYSISQAMSRFLRHIYEPGTDPRKHDRYSYKLGSSRNGVEVFDDVHAYSYHSTDPVCGQCLNAFDLVRLHLFGDRDAKTDPRTRIDRRPSYIAMQELAQRDPGVRADMVRQLWGDSLDDLSESCSDGSPAPSRQKSPKEHPTQTVDTPIDDGSSEEEDDSWIGEIELDKGGKVRPTVENIYRILEGDPDVKGKYYLDMFSGRVMISGDLPWSRSGGQEWDDNDDAGLRRWLENKYGISSPSKVSDAYSQYTNQHQRNPVIEHIESSRWDGTPRLDTVFIDYLGAPDTSLIRAMTRKSITAAVARVYSPGCKYDQITVLAGREGIGKSSLLKSLGGRWFSDSFVSIEGKEAMEQIAGAWIIELAELNGLKRAEMTTIKAFVSKQEDGYRAAYAKRKTHSPRRCVFFGTTNEVDFLRNENGNRRFWVIPVGEVEASKSPWELPKDPELGQIWAEALQVYKDGEPLYLNREEEAELKKLQDRYTAENGIVGVLTEYLDKPIPDGYYKMTPEERRYYCRGLYSAITSPWRADQMRRREWVCLAEIRSECLGMQPTETRRDKEIRQALQSVEGWVKEQNPMRISGYGLAKVWRCVSPKPITKSEIPAAKSAIDELLDGL